MDNIPWEDKTRQRAIVVTDEIWQRVLAEAENKNIVPAVVCEAAIDKHLQAEKLPDAEDFAALSKSRHNIRVRDAKWKPLQLRALEENQSASSLLEQVLRLYFGQSSSQLGGR